MTGRGRNGDWTVTETGQNAESAEKLNANMQISMENARLAILYCFLAILIELRIISPFFYFILALQNSGFDSKRSLSFIPTHEIRTINYGTGNVVTSIAQDAIKLNSLIINNQSFGVALKQEKFPDNFFSFSSVIIRILLI